MQSVSGRVNAVRMLFSLLTAYVASGEPSEEVQPQKRLS